MVQPSEGASKLHNLKVKLHQTYSSISNLRAQLRVIKPKQKEAKKDLASARSRLKVTEMNLRDVRDQLHTTRQKLTVTRSELAVIRRRFKQRNDLLAARLVDSYKHGNISYLSVLAGAADFWDLLNEGHIVHKVVQRDVDLLEAIRQDKRDIESHERVLAQQERRRTGLEQRQKQLAWSAHEQTIECKQMIWQLQAERNQLESQIAAEMQASSSIGAMIRRLQATPQGRKRMAQTWHGSFTMPVNGRITSPFGRRFHPILHSYRPHTGTDIAAPIGTPIHAAASGVVVFAGKDRVYGNLLVIDHGGGMSTFYGHCSRLAARRGASVSRGQVIAYVGSTGWSTGPHVHFEVQRNGRAVSPYSRN